MPESYRLTRPIAAEVAVPGSGEEALAARILSEMREAGISYVNLRMGKDVRAGLEMARSLRGSAELALTVSEICGLTVEALGPLAPCTLRLQLDPKRPLPASDLALLRKFVQLGCALVGVGRSLDEDDGGVWQELWALGWLTAMNIEEEECSSLEKYTAFIGRLEAFQRKAPMPLISDLPLAPRLGSPAFLPSGMCPAGRLSVFVSAAGEVYPCRKSDFMVGSLMTHGLVELWNDPRLGEWASIPEECVLCVLTSCKGGCRIRGNVTRTSQRDWLCPGPINVDGTDVGDRQHG